MTDGYEVHMMQEKGVRPAYHPKTVNVNLTNKEKAQELFGIYLTDEEFEDIITLVKELLS